MIESTHKEYLRRNLIHAKAVGADATARIALERLRELKRPQKWMIKYLEAIINRTGSVHPEVAKWRDTVDRPEHVK